jgi:rod shape-determining protein MreC
MTVMIAGVLLVLANAIGLLSPVKILATTISRPFQYLATHTGSATGNFFDVISSAGSLAADNKRLEGQVNALRQQAARNTELQAENDALRKQLGFGAIRPQRLIGAEVIGYQPDNFRQFILIGRGTNDGVHNGMAVISEGSLVGTVSEATATTAKVFLVIDPNYRVAGLDQDQPTRPTGTVHGLIGGGLVMEKIAQSETVKAGDTIITSGLADGVPKGIMIGQVQTINAKDNGVFQTAQLSSGLKFNRLELVYVVARP